MGLEASLLAEIGDRLVLLARAGSTNDEAKALAVDGAAHRTLVAADEQESGRGRRGAEWFSGPGEGLAFSVVLRPAWEAARWGWLGLGAALAVAEVLEKRGFGPAIKWPNDLLLEGRKVCGILVETVPGAAVVGMGLNVNEERFPEGIEAASLRSVAGREFVREELLVAVWERFEAVLDRGPDLIAEAVWQRLAWRGEVVETTAGVRGVIRGFGEWGELLLESRGEVVRVTDADSLRVSRA